MTVEHVPLTYRSSNGASPSSQSWPHRWPFAILAGLMGGTVALLLGRTGLLSNWIALIVSIFVGILLASGRNLAGRIVSVLMIGLASCFPAWLLPLPGDLTRSDLMLTFLGVIWGTRLCWIALQGEWTRLLPRPNSSDFALLTTALLGVVVLRHYLFVSDFAEAVSIAASRWDNSSHYFITEMMRSTQQVLPVLGPAGDGTAYMLTHYPAGYHAVVALIMSLLSGAGAADATIQLVLFVRVVGVVQILLAVLVASSVVALPGSRRSPLQGGFGAAAAGSVFLLGPGAVPFTDAYYNFVFSVAIVAATACVALGADRLFTPRTPFVLVAGIVGASTGWIPMGLLAALFALTAVFPTSTVHFRASLREMILGVLVVLTGAACSLLAYSWSRQETSGQNILDIPTPLDRVAPMQFTLGAAAVLFAGVSPWARWLHGGTLPIRLRRSTLVALVAALSLAGFWLVAADQLGRTRGVLYYPAKFGNGVVAIAWVLGCAALAQAETTPSMPSPLGFRKFLSWVLALLLAGVGSLSMGPIRSGGVLGRDVPISIAAAASDRLRNEDLVKALETALDQRPDVHVLLVLNSRSDTIPGLTALSEALRRTYTEGGDQLILDVARADPPLGKPVDVVEKARPHLADGSWVMVVNPAEYQSYKMLVGPELESRVSTWT